MQSTPPSPPKLQDFSQRAIQGHVVWQGLTHWLTLYPPALALPLGFAAYLFNTPLLYLGLLGGLTVGLGSAIVNIFFRGEALSASYLQQLVEGSQRQKAQMLEGLRRSLQQAERIAGAEAYAEQGLEQFERMRVKFDKLGSLLATRFQHGELSYGRFLGAAEQVYLGSLDTLQRIIVLLESVGGIDLDYIDKQLASIKEPTNEADRKERETLIRRSKLRCEQLERVNELLAANEEAMTALEETVVAVAAMSTNTALAQGDFEAAIAQLQQVAVRARQY
ncbi:MAG: hypothetical protein CDV28_11928 [Candidatus Electronema aureum]|uniref:Uncharacterized protein n=1 Tax=Candidatus Electronema aureum TaxID=2005002 RepID=A0A521G132_9BACT|nr:MAG: hypothetical protein CDV28_11928 [Candidatus Electronema aureum]